MQAQLRACVFAVVEEQDGKSYGTGMHLIQPQPSQAPCALAIRILLEPQCADLERRANNPRKAKLFGQPDGMLLATLIREFLEWSHMTYALKVTRLLCQGWASPQALVNMKMRR